MTDSKTLPKGRTLDWQCLATDKVAYPVFPRRPRKSFNQSLRFGEVEKDVYCKECKYELGKCNHFPFEVKPPGLNHLNRCTKSTNNFNLKSSKFSYRECDCLLNELKVSLEAAAALNAKSDDGSFYPINPTDRSTLRNLRNLILRRQIDCNCASRCRCRCHLKNCSHFRKSRVRNVTAKRFSNICNYDLPRNKYQQENYVSEYSKSCADKLFKITKHDQTYNVTQNNKLINCNSLGSLQSEDSSKSSDLQKTKECDVEKNSCQNHCVQVDDDCQEDSKFDGFLNHGFVNFLSKPILKKNNQNPEISKCLLNKTCSDCSTLDEGCPSIKNINDIKTQLRLLILNAICEHGLSETEADMIGKKSFQENNRSQLKTVHFDISKDSVNRHRLKTNENAEMLNDAKSNNFLTDLCRNENCDRFGNELNALIRKINFMTNDDNVLNTNKIASNNVQIKSLASTNDRKSTLSECSDSDEENRKGNISKNSKTNGNSSKKTANKKSEETTNKTGQNESSKKPMVSGISPKGGAQSEQTSVRSGYTEYSEDYDNSTYDDDDDDGDDDDDDDDDDDYHDDDEKSTESEIRSTTSSKKRQKKGPGKDVSEADKLDKNKPVDNKPTLDIISKTSSKKGKKKDKQEFEQMSSGSSSEASEYSDVTSEYSDVSAEEYSQAFENKKSSAGEKKNSLKNTKTNKTSLEKDKNVIDKSAQFEPPSSDDEMIPEKNVKRSSDASKSIGSTKSKEKKRSKAAKNLEQDKDYNSDQDINTHEDGSIVYEKKSSKKNSEEKKSVSSSFLGSQHESRVNQKKDSAGSGKKSSDLLRPKSLKVGEPKTSLESGQSSVGSSVTEVTETSDLGLDETAEIQKRKRSPSKPSETIEATADEDDHSGADAVVRKRSSEQKQRENNVAKKSSGSAHKKSSEMNGNKYSYESLQNNDAHEYETDRKLSSGVDRNVDRIKNKKQFQDSVREDRRRSDERSSERMKTKRESICSDRERKRYAEDKSSKRLKSKRESSCSDREGRKYSEDRCFERMKTKRESSCSDGEERMKTKRESICSDGERRKYSEDKSSERMKTKRESICSDEEGSSDDRIPEKMKRKRESVCSDIERRRSFEQSQSSTCCKRKIDMCCEYIDRDYCQRRRSFLAEQECSRGSTGKRSDRFSEQFSPSRRRTYDFDKFCCQDNLMVINEKKRSRPSKDSCLTKSPKYQTPVESLNEDYICCRSSEQRLRPIKLNYCATEKNDYSFGNQLENESPRISVINEKRSVDNYRICEDEYDNSDYENIDIGIQRSEKRLSPKGGRRVEKCESSEDYIKYVEYESDDSGDRSSCAEEYDEEPMDVRREEPVMKKRGYRDKDKYCDKKMERKKNKEFESKVDDKKEKEYERSEIEIQTKAYRDRSDSDKNCGDYETSRKISRKETRKPKLCRDRDDIDKRHNENEPVRKICKKGTSKPKPKPPEKLRCPSSDVKIKPRRVCGKKKVKRYPTDKCKKVSSNRDDYKDKKKDVSPRESVKEEPEPLRKSVEKDHHEKAKNQSKLEHLIKDKDICCIVQKCFEKWYAKKQVFESIIEAKVKPSCLISNEDNDKCDHKDRVDFSEKRITCPNQNEKLPVADAGFEQMIYPQMLNTCPKFAPDYSDDQPTNEWIPESDSCISHDQLERLEMQLKNYISEHALSKQQLSPYHIAMISFLSEELRSSLLDKNSTCENGAQGRSSTKRTHDGFPKIVQNESHERNQQQDLKRIRQHCRNSSNYCECIECQGKKIHRFKNILKDSKNSSGDKCSSETSCCKNFPNAQYSRSKRYMKRPSATNCKKINLVHQPKERSRVNKLQSFAKKRKNFEERLEGSRKCAGKNSYLSPAKKNSFTISESSDKFSDYKSSIEECSNFKMLPNNFGCDDNMREGHTMSNTGSSLDVSVLNIFKNPRKLKCCINTSEFQLKESKKPLTETAPPCQQFVPNTNCHIPECFGYSPHFITPKSSPVTHLNPTPLQCLGNNDNFLCFQPTNETFLCIPPIDERSPSIQFSRFCFAIPNEAEYSCAKRELQPQLNLNLEKNCDNCCANNQNDANELTVNHFTDRTTDNHNQFNVGLYNNPCLIQHQPLVPKAFCECKIINPDQMMHYTETLRQHTIELESNKTNKLYLDLYCPVINNF